MFHLVVHSQEVQHKESIPFSESPNSSTVVIPSSAVANPSSLVVIPVVKLDPADVWLLDKVSLANAECARKLHFLKEKRCHLCHELDVASAAHKGSFNSSLKEIGVITWRVMLVA